MNAKTYNQLSDDDLISLLKMRMVNLKYDAKLDNVTIVDRLNIDAPGKYFTVRFSISNEYGKNEHCFMFNRLYLDEWDYVHERLEQLGTYPLSDFVRRKNSHITDLELSNRGYLSAFKIIKEKAKSIYDQISVP